MEHRLIWALILLVFHSNPCPAQNESTSPRVFAPGVISGPAHDSAPAFDPNGKTVYFARSNTSSSTILVSIFKGHGWTSPAIAAFSGEWDDQEPAMSPDGSFLLFISNRPLTKGARPLDGFYNGRKWPMRGSALWRVDRTDAGWGHPFPLPAEVNDGSSVFAPAVAMDGSLYFMKPNGAKGKFRLFRAQRAGVGFESPHPVSFSTGEFTDVDPAVAPDESFIVFGSNRPPALTSIDPFIVFREATGWGEPQHLGDLINSPGSDAEARLSPDHRTLFFSSDRVVPTSFPESKNGRQRDLHTMSEWNNSLYNIWYVSLNPFLKKP